MRKNINGWSAIFSSILGARLQNFHRIGQHEQLEILQCFEGILRLGFRVARLIVINRAGIATSALLGPHCKSAVTVGNTLTVICEEDDDPTNADGVTTLAPADVPTASANLSGATAKFTRSDASTFTLDLSALQPDGGLGQAAVDARVAAGVAGWAQTGNNDAINSAKLTNAPETPWPRRPWRAPP